MNKEQIKDAIRALYHGKDWARLAFILAELSHAVVNIPREWFRSAGAPDAPPGKANWADWVSRLFWPAIVATLLFLIYTRTG